MLTKHRGSPAGYGSGLTEEGWAIGREIAEAVAEEAERSCAGGRGGLMAAEMNKTTKVGIISCSGEEIAGGHHLP